MLFKQYWITNTIPTYPKKKKKTNTIPVFIKDLELHFKDVFNKHLYYLILSKSKFCLFNVQ
jgi:hypothetical protein